MKIQIREPHWLVLSNGTGAARIVLGMLPMMVGFWLLTGNCGTARLIMGLALAAGGLFCLLAKNRYTIDKQRQLLTVQWCFLLPVYTKHIPLCDYRLRLERLKGDLASNAGQLDSYTYPITLVHADGQLELDRPQRYEHARVKAQRMANFLKVQFDDQSDHIQEAADHARRAWCCVRIPAARHGQS